VTVGHAANIDDSVCRHCIKALSQWMRVINVCISSSVHSIEAARSERFIGGQLSEQTTAAVCGNIRVIVFMTSILSSDV